MKGNVFREYRFKFYLNASHYVIFNNKKGEIHPHTWEFAVDILIDRNRYMEFNDFERGITAFIAPYQDRVVNELEPFDLIIPTLESMLDYFAPEIYKIIRDLGGLVIRVEGSETPTRSYIYTFEDEKVRTAGENLVRSNREAENRLVTHVDTGASVPGPVKKNPDNNEGINASMDDLINRIINNGIGE
ncbi:MAG: 6-carboxytetrahydropterin synthase [Lachnospiraceae bacterium]|nr:6-carboxytetrahydropterin synthase [Lachnospiraceae bacterium]